jgi:hypothetical protein
VSTLSPFLDQLAAELDVLRGGAAEVHGDGTPAQHFLHGAIDHVVVAVDARLRSSAIWSGRSASAFRPAAIVYRLVSLPALIISTKRFLYCRSVRHSPSIVGASSAEIRSWPGVPDALGLLLRVLVQLERGRRAERDVLELVGVGEARRRTRHLRVEVAEQRVARFTSQSPSLSGTPSMRPSMRIGSCFAISSV